MRDVYVAVGEAGGYNEGASIRAGRSQSLSDDINGDVTRSVKLTPRR